jgi:hypothetical protein
MADHSAAIARLQRVFGNVDKDVLLAVLEVCGGNDKDAEKYLQATDGGGYDARTLSTVEGGLPKDYPGQSKTVSGLQRSSAFVRCSEAIYQNRLRLSVPCRCILNFPVFCRTEALSQVIGQAMSRPPPLLPPRLQIHMVKLKS